MTKVLSLRARHLFRTQWCLRQESQGESTLPGGSRRETHSTLPTAGMGVGKVLRLRIDA